MILFVNHLHRETGWSMAVEMLNQKSLMMCSVRARENDGTEREAQGVGRDMSCPRKLFLTQRKSRFSGGSLFSETSACSLASFSGS